jgi:hypothetical protein
MTYLQQAEKFTKAAEQAARAGDQIAFVALITVAAQFVQLARLTENKS